MDGNHEKKMYLKAFLLTQEDYFGQEIAMSQMVSTKP